MSERYVIAWDAPEMTGIKELDGDLRDCPLMETGDVCRRLNELLAENAALKAKLPQGPRVRIKYGRLAGKEGILYRELQGICWVWLDDDFARGLGASRIPGSEFEVITNEGATS